MKIGTSYSRCLVDIYEKRVDINDVMVIVARTYFDPTIDSQWNNIWLGYSMMLEPWAEYTDKEAEFRELTMELWNNGLLHQPRKFGAHARRTDQIWYDTILTNEIKDNNPAVKKAWEQYKMIANLT